MTGSAWRAASVVAVLGAAGCVPVGEECAPPTDELGSLPEGQEPPQDADGGISIGNPFECSTVHMAIAASEGIVLDRATFQLRHVALIDCHEGETEHVPDTTGELDLLGHDPIDLPAAWYCGLAFASTDGLVVEGSGTEGGTFEARFETLTRVTVIPPEPAALQGEALVLELGYPGWIDPDELGLEPDVHVVYEPGVPGYTEGVRRLRDGSGLYRDPSGDGRVDEEERAAGTVLRGEGRPADL